MTDPTTALIAYLLPGIAYGAWCLGALVADGVPLRGLALWRNLLMVVGAWPLVLLGVAVAKVNNVIRAQSPALQAPNGKPRPSGRGAVTRKMRRAWA